MPPQSQNYGLRPDGTPKGNGFFGPLMRPDGAVSTEISIGVDFDGRETQIPSLVPTLTPAERDYLLAGNDPTPTIVQKAVDHARQRMAKGLSPFATDSEKLNWNDINRRPPSGQPMADALAKIQGGGGGW